MLVNIKLNINRHKRITFKDCELHWFLLILNDKAKTKLEILAFLKNSYVISLSLKGIRTCFLLGGANVTVISVLNGLVL